MVFGKVLNSAEGGYDALADLESFQNIGLPHNLRVQLGLLRMQGKERPAESGLSESLIWRKTTNSGANLWQRKALHSIIFRSLIEPQPFTVGCVFQIAPNGTSLPLYSNFAPTRLLEKSQLPHSQEFSINRRHLLKEEPCLKVCGNFPSLLILSAGIPTSRFTATSDDKVAVHRV